MEERYQKFTTLIAKCSRAIKRLKSNEMLEFNLKSLHVSCLYYLYTEERSLTAKELCDICVEDKSYVSKAIEALEMDGFVTCQSKMKKRYNSPISLTEKGSAVAEKLARKIDNIVAKASEGLSEENRKIFYASLTLISNNLDKLCENY